MEKDTSLQRAFKAEYKDQSLFDSALSMGKSYLDEVFDREVFPTKEALDNLTQFEETLPLLSSDSASVLQTLHDIGSPATVASLGGKYFGFVTGSALPIGMAAKNLATFWDQGTAMQVMSPVCSKLETVVEQWLKELFELPSSTVAGFVSGTSSANLCGLLAARYRMSSNLGWDVNEEGLFGAPKMRIVTGRQAHSTILKAIGMIGFGKANIEWVDVDDQGRIIAEQVPELDHSTLLILQAGNVNTGSFDDFVTLCDKAKKANAWVHIDGAFGLWAGAVEKLKHLTKGINIANSWAVDGHKTLNTPYDSGVILCADPQALTSALHMSGSYIIEGKDRDGMFYTPEMSRRARIVEFWATMKYLGKKGIDQMVLTMHERAVELGEGISVIEGYEVLNEVVFNQVIVAAESDEITLKAMAQIQDNRDCWVGGSVWQGRKVIRVSICSWATTSEDINIAIASFRKALG